MSIPHTKNCNCHDCTLKRDKPVLLANQYRTVAATIRVTGLEKPDRHWWVTYTVTYDDKKRAVLQGRMSLDQWNRAVLNWKDKS
jgi:hypothetical protein